VRRKGLQKSWWMSDGLVPLQGIFVRIDKNLIVCYLKNGRLNRGEQCKVRAGGVGVGVGVG